MRILHLINHCRFGHGNVHAAVDLACAQVQAGDRVTMASGLGEFIPLLERQGVAHILLDQENRRPLQTLRMTVRLRRIIRRIRPDVVHAHMMTGAVVGWIGTRLTHVPMVTTVHNAFENHATLMGLGDRVIAVSEAVARNMAGRGVPQSKLRTVLNGTLGAPRRDYFDRAPLLLRHPNIVTVCGLHDRKGVRDLLSAFDLVAGEFPQTHLYLAGDGPLRSTYERLTQSLDVSDRVHFLGQLTDTKSLLEQTDVFVLASHADPAPLVLPEAREARCAIVATNVDGIPELLDHGTAGELVAAKDPQAIACAIGRLFRDPGALDAAKIRAGTNIGYWSTSRVAAQTRAVYRELIREG